METDKNIKTSTIRVPKSVLDDIKIYCRKAGQPVGEWVETAWRFLEKNDFDIYDQDATPCLPVAPEIEKERGQVDALCNLMAQFIKTAQSAAQLPAPDVISQAAADQIAQAMADKARAEEQTETVKAQALADARAQELEQLRTQTKAQADAQAQELEQLRAQVKALQDDKKRAYAELCRVRDEQPYLGKIDVNTTP